MRKLALVGFLIIPLVVASCCEDDSEKGLREALRPLATKESTPTMPSTQGVTTEAVGASAPSQQPPATQSWPTYAPIATPPIPGKMAIPLEYGIQIHGCGYPVGPALDLAVDAGFTVVKQQVRWEELEPEFLSPDWRCLDEVVDEAEKRNLKVLLSVTTSPEWSRPGMAQGSPRFLPMFAQFCLRLATRYAGRLYAIEVWNEPNLDIEWGDYLDPESYYALLEWAYFGIKQGDPDVIVISAGLAPTEWNDWATAIDDKEFLRLVAESNDSLPADCVGTHFNHGVSSPLEPGGPFEQQMIEYYDTFGGQRPLCITEFGIATPDRTGGQLPEGFEWAADTSAAEQSEWLVDGLEWAEAHPDMLGMVIVWNLNYHDDNFENNNVLYALWGPGGMMPAYDAVKSWLRAR